MLQKTALGILKSGQNVFLTGSAGAGKTYVINQYIEYLRDRDVALAITASTGIAATHIGGMTIHSWSGMGIKDEITDFDLEKMAKKKPLRERLEKVQVLIIDEVSMLSAKNLACIDEILRFFKVSFEPFGGIQVIFSGDFFQLPPVSKERLPSYKRLAFMAPVWVELGLQICYLTEQFRSGDGDLLAVLNDIRTGDVSDSTQDLVREKMEESLEYPDEHAIRLFTHNVDVDAVNEEELRKVKGPMDSFYGTSQGAANLVKTLKKSVLAPDVLELKKGAQVMFVKNNYECGYMNGTMGTVTDYTSDGWPIVTTLDDRELVGKPMEWQVVDETGKPVALYSQIPLRLAWAITVHKSQGMTLDRAVVDLSKTFEAGQGYVALSRVKTWEGLSLIGCNSTATMMDDLVMKADKRLQELAIEVESEFEKITEAELKSAHEKFILKAGGTIDPKQIAFNQGKPPEKIAPKKKKAKTGSTYEATKALIKEGKTLTEIVEARELGLTTIVSHISKISKTDPDLDFTLYRPEEVVVKDVRVAITKLAAEAIDEDLDSDGHIKLGLIHRELKGKYDYETIRLAKIFF